MCPLQSEAYCDMCNRWNFCPVQRRPVGASLRPLDVRRDKKAKDVSRYDAVEMSVLLWRVDELASSLDDIQNLVLTLIT